MERSKAISGLYKGRYVDRSPQRHRIRLSSIEQAMEYEDWAEESIRYVDSKQAARSESRGRPQPRGMGEYSQVSED